MDFPSSQCLLAATSVGYSDLDSTLTSIDVTDKPKGCHVYRGDSYVDGDFSWNDVAFNTNEGTAGRNDIVTIQITPLKRRVLYLVLRGK